MEATIYNQKGKEAGKVTLPEVLFGRPWNADLVHQAVLTLEGNARAGTAHTKDRGEVAGGGRKPWRQKGTGRARHGSIRSPLWKGGGVTHGPRTEKNYARKLNKKALRAAFATMLSAKWKEGRVVFVDDLAVKGSKTKEAAKVFVALKGLDGLSGIGEKKPGNVVIATAKKDKSLERSYRNIPGVSISEARNLNPLDLWKHRYVIVVSPEESMKALTRGLAT